MLPWFQNGRFPLYLAPMAGFTDSVFRRLCRREGADVLVTEFVLADAVVRDRERTWETIAFTPDERPIGVQIFGSSPAIMAEAARRISHRLGPDFVDLNFGCPAPKVTQRMAGCALLRDLPQMGRIARAVRRALSDTPLTAKIRIGWDERTVVAVDAARSLEDAGVEALAVHGRTREQGYRGDADWRVIEDVVNAVGIPVICNGGIGGDDQSLMWIRNSGARGAMVGRAALGNPWIFSQIKNRIGECECDCTPSVENRLSTLLHYAELLQARPNSRVDSDSIRWMSPRLKAFMKDMAGASRFRRAIDSIRTMDELTKLCMNFPRDRGELANLISA